MGVETAHPLTYHAAPVRKHGSRPGFRFTIPGTTTRLPLGVTTPVGGISERAKEIKRRRHRRQKLQKLAVKLKKATTSEKTVIAQKVRMLTPGADVILKSWGLSER